jgi:hypothetical protein
MTNVVVALEDEQPPLIVDRPVDDRDPVELAGRYRLTWVGRERLAA